MNPQPTLQTLQLDCLLEILQYVPLPECMLFRSLCRYLKAVVDEHFRTSVRKLPVLLSGPHLPKRDAQEEKSYWQNLLLNKGIIPLEISFGSASGVCHRTIYENKDVYPSVEAFQLRGENYLILSDLAKFDAFVNFIAKYLPNITELELVIDHNDHLENIPTILNLYQKQLKVLLLEQTTRCSKWHRKNFVNVEDSTDIPVKILCSIESLDAIEKLYFFSKWTDSILRIFNCFPAEYRRQVLEKLHKIFNKLKVLHLPEISDFQEYFKPNVYVNLEELGIAKIAEDLLQSSGFPKLEKLIVFQGVGIDKLEPKLMPNLKTLCFYDPDRTVIEKLNKFPNLERLYCSKLYGNSPIHMLARNRSIKYIEMEKLSIFYLDYNDSSDSYTFPGYEIVFEMMKNLEIFTGLEKVILREPFIELTGSELREILN